MAKTASDSQVLRKGAKVVARTELREVPEGTTGKVIMVDGFSWIRYWVRFDNGISLGTIDRKFLATPDEWQRFLAGDEELVSAGAGASSDGDDAGADDGDAGGGKTTANGTFVPQKFLDRSAAARARLAA